MAVPRPFVLLAALGAVLMAATFYAVRGAHEAAHETPTLPKSAQTQLAPVKQPATKTHRSPRAHQKPSANSKRHTAAPPATKPHKRTAPAHRTKDSGATVGVPRRVAEALGQKRVVVLFFYERGAADDDATARSVAAVRGHGGRVSVFTAPASKLSEYRRLISGLDISSVPSTVVVGRDRKAHVLEGFVDARSLIQEVADAAR